MRTERGTDRQTERERGREKDMSELIVTFCSFAKAPEKRVISKERQVFLFSRLTLTADSVCFLEAAGH